jgi:hypothetical protein
MPGIDFRAARARLALAEVLALISFEPRTRWGEQLRAMPDTSVTLADESRFRGPPGPGRVALLRLRGRRQRTRPVGGGDPTTAARGGY